MLVKKQNMPHVRYMIIWGKIKNKVHLRSAEAETKIDLQYDLLTAKNSNIYF